MTYKYRLQFSKQGSAIWLGHLEVTDIMRRACRMAGWKMRYSEGFHPLPKVSMGDALPVGMESHAEFFDVEVDSPPSSHPSLIKGEGVYGGIFPLGVSIVDMWKLRDNAPSIQSGMDSTIYHLSSLACDAESLRKKVGEFLNVPEIRVSIQRRDKVFVCDLKPFVSRLAVEDDGVIVLGLRNLVQKLKVNEFIKFGLGCDTEGTKIVKVDVEWRDDGK